VGGLWWAVPETPTRNLAGVIFLVPLSSRAADLVLFLMRSGQFLFFEPAGANDVNKIPK
jgi:hypothetical protein